MREAVLRFPVACPECARELLMEFPTDSIAAALDAGDAIRLHASCHGRTWNAGRLEREQVREYLEATHLSRA